MSTTRELRIAPVMTGGSSLAVWMGGVTSELYSMIRSNDAHSGVAEIYKRLLRLSETRPVVDVITGTSAGGLNGSLLAMAVATRVDPTDFDTIRDTWMRTANLDDLIRQPNEPDPPSLLRGDDYFLKRIETVLEGWTEQGTWQQDGIGNVDLVTTYTNVTPVVAHRRDDFASRFDEYVYAGTLRFEAKDFEDTDIVQKIAIASRTSASIPAVFEPSYLPSTPRDATASGRPNFARHQPPNARRRSRWAVDGGLVVNLPLTEALQRVFDQSATSSVRRVFLYVRPTPTALEAEGSQTHDEMPTILESLLTVKDAPKAEGIASDIDTIHRHNEIVRRKQLIRRNLPQLIGPLESFLTSGDDDAPPPLFELFRECRTQRSIERTFGRIVDTRSPDTVLDEAEVRRALTTHRRDLLPLALDRFDSPRQSWAWGIAPIEEAGSTVLGLVNRAFELNHRRRGRSPEEDREADDRGQVLRDAKQAVHLALDHAEAVRIIDDRYWCDRADRWQPDTDPYEAWPYVDDGAGDRDDVLRRLQHAHANIASALLDVAPTIETVTHPTAGRTTDGENLLVVAHDDGRRGMSVRIHVDHHDDRSGDGRTDGRSWIAERAADLRQELETVWRPGCTIEEQQRRLLLHHVASTVLLDDPTPREQPSEIMQVSWDAKNELDPRPPDDKLAGSEFARFGAFVKPSWRANDWMWGRMDGAAQLVRLLVEPVRWYDLGHSRSKVKHDLGLPDDPDIDAELGFLDTECDPAHDAPPLVKTTQWLRAQLQHRIGIEELPRVAAAGRTSAAMGSTPPDWERFPAEVEAAFADRSVPDDLTIKRLVRSSPIGTETAGSELGSDTTVRLGTRAMAVAANALTGARAGLGPIAPPLKPIRPVVRSTSSVVSLMNHPSRFVRTLMALVLAIAGALVGVGLVSDAVPPLLTTTSLVVFVAAIVIALVRSRSTATAIVLVATAIPIALAIVGDDLEDVMYSTAPAADPIALPASGEISVDGDAVVTVRQPNGDNTLDQDIALPAGTTLSITSGSAIVTSTDRSGVADWKRYGLIGNGPDGWPGLLPVLTVTNVVLLLSGIALTWWGVHRYLEQRRAREQEEGSRDRRPPDDREHPLLHRPTVWWKLTAAGLVALVLTFATSWLGSMLLTGAVPADQASADGVKGFVMWSARRLSEWELLFLVVTLAFVGAAIGTGLDRLLRPRHRPTGARSTGFVTAPPPHGRVEVRRQP